MSEFTLKEWIAAPTEAFNAITEFEEQVMPLLNQFDELAREHEVPFYMHFVVNSINDESKHFTQVYIPGAEYALPELLAGITVSEIKESTVPDLVSLFNICVDKYGSKPVPMDPELAEPEGATEFSLSQWANTPAKDFNHMDIYKELMEPMAKEIKDLCVKLRIPMCGMATPMFGDGQASLHNLACMGGINRATADIIAGHFISPFNEEAINNVEAVVRAFLIKFGQTESEFLFHLFKG